MAEKPPVLPRKEGFDWLDSLWDNKVPGDILMLGPPDIPYDLLDWGIPLKYRPMRTSNGEPIPETIYTRYRQHPFVCK